MSQVISLDELRCPDATIKMRKIVYAFLDSELQSITLESVEPSLVRSLPALLVTLESPVRVTDSSEREITKEDRLKWDEDSREDNADVTKWQVLTITKGS